ncbi:uncharacterized protein [Lepeophtheirus salmonis]|uniref:uncharacterized protein n=1 Tax=Lepeophtheirus salmonis TaxID=72036 RepID=UPI001AE574B9|nr:uncharacterized serine-rich protein C215.13-like [Lepeophtheirus salmonis]
MFKLCAILLLSSIHLPLHECRVVKRDDSSHGSIISSNVVKRYVTTSHLGSSTGVPAKSSESSSNPINVATYTIITSSGDNESNRFVRDSSNSAPTSNNVFLSSSNSQPVYTSYVSNPVPTSYISNPVSTSYISNPVSTSSISSPVSSSSITYPSSSSSVSSSVSSSAPSVSITTVSPLASLASITALLSPKSSSTGGSTGGSDVLSGVGGALSAASSGVKTVLEIKRDIVIPVVMGLIEFLKNVVSSETLQTIANVQLNAARTALDLGPTFIQTLAGIATTAGEVTSTLINVILCSFICPFQADQNACRVQASCSAASSSNTVSTSYSSPSSSPSTYTVS